MVYMRGIYCVIENTHIQEVHTVLPAPQVGDISGCGTPIVLQACVRASKEEGFGHFHMAVTACNAQRSRALLHTLLIQIHSLGGQHGTHHFHASCPSARYQETLPPPSEVVERDSRVGTKGQQQVDHTGVPTSHRSDIKRRMAVDIHCVDSCPVHQTQTDDFWLHPQDGDEQEDIHQPKATVISLEAVMSGSDQSFNERGVVVDDGRMQPE